MKKSTLLRNLICLLLGAMLLSGCSLGGDWDLSEEDEAKVVQYAAGLLMKYERGDMSHLMDDDKLQEALLAQEQKAKEAAELQARVNELKKLQAKEEESPASTEETSDGAVDTAQVESIPSISQVSVENACNVSGINFTYTGYDITDAYPARGEEADSMYFAMSASGGKDLLVLKFNAVNNSSEDIYLDMASSNTKFRLSVNGGPVIAAQITMLLNDMTYYQGNISPGSSEELVVVFEIDEQISAGIENLELTIKNGDNQTTARLN